MDFALLILRVVVGSYLVVHGTQKLFGWFGGPGFQRWLGAMAMQGYRPAGFWAVLGALSEAGGGALLFLGFLSPLGALAVAASMVVAVGTHWKEGPLAQNRGYEHPLTNLAVAVALALLGSGAYSVDALAGITLPEPATLVVGIVLVLLGGVAAFGSRRPTAQPAQQRTA